MESIFESLENLQVSEACFDEIMDMVEEILDEAVKDDVRYHHKGADGSAVFDYKGERYTYGPEWGEERFAGPKMKLKKTGKVSPDYNKGPITRAIEGANQKFDDARTEKYQTRRNARKANEKLNQLVKEFTKKNGKNSFPAKTTPEIDQALNTVKKTSDKALEADNKFADVNNAQKKDGESGLASGLKYEGRDIYHTKKGDNIGFKPVVKKS